MRLDLASGWQLEIAIERDQLGALLWAQAPDGRDWVYGCQRDDWTLGPDSRIVEPVALLEPEQRQQLEQLLRGALCWPAPLVTCGWVVPMGKVKPSPYARREGGGVRVLPIDQGISTMQVHIRIPGLSLSLMARSQP